MDLLPEISPRGYQWRGTHGSVLKASIGAPTIVLVRWTKLNYDEQPQEIIGLGEDIMAQATQEHTPLAGQDATEDLTLQQFEEIVKGEHLYPHWVARANRARELRTPIQPYLWSWKLLRRRMLQVGDLIPLGKKGAERRALTLRNPSLPEGRMGTTHTLVAAVQMVHGTEVAPSHRHTPAALRLIKEGKGACTVVNGEPESMEKGDLLLTPSWYWHGHFSEHDEPMLWMDGLDAPLVLSLGANFFEEYPTQLQPASAPRDESIRRYSGGGLLPVGERTASLNSPLLNYRWARTEEKLMQLVNRDGSPFDGVALQFTNPFTGGPVMPTIDCWIQLLRPGEKTKAHRHTSSVVYNVVRGSGTTMVDGVRLDWTEGDFFCLPTWAGHHHTNGSSSEDAILFSMNDSPVLKALGMYREASCEEGEKH